MQATVSGCSPRERRGCPVFARLAPRHQPAERPDARADRGEPPLTRRPAFDVAARLVRSRRPTTSRVAYATHEITGVDLASPLRIRQVRAAQRTGRLSLRTPPRATTVACPRARLRRASIGPSLLVRLRLRAPRGRLARGTGLRSRSRPWPSCFAAPLAFGYLCGGYLLDNIQYTYFRGPAANRSSREGSCPCS